VREWRPILGDMKARGWWLIGLVAVLGAVILGLPSAGSALLPTWQIALTPSGPSPSVLDLTAGGGYLFWINQDQVTHTVTFTDGQCSFQLAPGARGNCGNDFPIASVGEYKYTVDGTFQGSVIVSLNPQPRTVTLTARRHTINRGGRVLLHGMLDYPIGSPPDLYSRMPVTLLARPDRYHRFKRVAVTAKAKKRGPFGFPWRIYVHPKATTIYMAEATSNTDSWEPAMSRPFKVVVRANR
jgi:DNA-binding beta-propeller fold protein YncE